MSAKKLHSVLYLINITTLLIIVFAISTAGQNNPIKIKGIVKDASNNISLKGVNISVLNTSLGTTTDSFGSYVLTVNPGKYEIVFSYVGYKTLRKNINVNSNEGSIQLNILLETTPYTINGVTVKASRVISTHLVDSLKAKDIQKIPNLFSDVIKSVKFLPGVTTNNELTNKFNVRGGNFDQNLIYLNGYEIYQPHLVQQGIEESQSIVNENMVSGLQFYNGAFPVEFGDKLSSVLAINYNTLPEERLSGEVNADLFNLGITLHDKIGKLSWITGARYAYPSLFDKTLQSKGGYKPSFDDFQFLGSYNLTDRSVLQLLFITSKNNFDFTPQNWDGNFQLSVVDIRQTTLNFNGNSNYKYFNTLLGSKYITDLSENSNLVTSFAYYSDKEFNNKNLLYDVYYSQDAYHPNENKQYLESGHEFANDYVITQRFELKSDYSLSFSSQNIKAGAAVRFAKMKSLINELTYFDGVDSVLNQSSYENNYLNVNFNYVSAYAEDNIILAEGLTVNAGLRVLDYYFNNEFLLSPRAGLSYQLNNLNKINFAWGYYYQPPYIYETRDKSLSDAKSLSAQKNVQYNLSWQNNFKENSKFTAEIFYKNLSRLIPYNVDQVDLTYGDKNNYEGYAYGFDLQYQGELVEGMETWIGYGYLDAKERQTPGNYQYERSPVDQRHTIRIFLQDRSKSHPNFQAHTLFLFGSGYQYHPMVSVPGDTPGSYKIVPAYNYTYEYPFYFRVDMGLTFEFKIDEYKNIVLTADVYNVFNQYNIISYSWFHVLPQTKQPIPVPNILSPRYFNVGCKLNF